jgi:hypothetical protein
MRAITIIAGAMGLLMFSWARGGADIIHYIGPHPIDPQVHEGMCYIEGAHFHNYAPYKPLLYIKVDAGWTFVGDPVEFEKATPKFAYYGHHPIFWANEMENEEAIPEGHYCFISGPHYHWYAPPPRWKFKAKGGAYWYVGTPPGWYHKRKMKAHHLDHYYSTVYVEHPVITVEPPEGFIGIVVGPGHAHGRAVFHGGVEVAPPRIDVHIPAPSFGIVVGGGARVHHQDHIIVGPAGRGKHGPPSHAPAWGVRGHKGKGKWK